MYIYLVIAVCLTAAAFAVFQEYRQGGQLLAFRIMTSLVAVAALACIALPVSYRGKDVAAAGEAVLLTPGFKKDGITRYKTDSLLTFDVAINKEFPGVKLVTPGQIKSIRPKISRLQILGNGLHEYELTELDSVPIIFHPAGNPGGFNSISWNARLKQGQSLKVQGSYFNKFNTRLKIILKGPGTDLDSAVIAGHSVSKFELNSVPKGIGRSVFKLVTINGKDTLSNEEVPFIIEPVTPLKVLLLTASPGFENKFLKNWLTADGFAVASRSTISKDKFSSEYVNISRFPLYKINASLLEKFDVVISDISVLHSLSGAENNALKQQVTGKGLGLILRTDTSYKTSLWEQAGFHFAKYVSKDDKPGFLLINGAKTASKQNPAESLIANIEDGGRPLVRDEQNHSFAGLNIAGEGKIAVTALTSTYIWMLNGDKNDYAALWSLLISETARAVAPLDRWQTVGAIPCLNEPVRLQVQTGKQPKPMIVDSVNLAPVQDARLPFQWQSTWWPRTPGWHSAKLAGGEPWWLYVYDDQSWSSLKTLEKLKATNRYAALLKQGTVTKLIQQKIKIPVPKVYFYLLLLGACTFLWIEGKRRRQKV